MEILHRISLDLPILIRMFCWKTISSISALSGKGNREVESRNNNLAWAGFVINPQLLLLSHVTRLLLERFSNRIIQLSQNRIN